MTVPNSPTEAGGEKLAFLLADNSGTNVAALLHGTNFGTVNAEQIADLVCTLDSESITFSNANIGGTADAAAASGAAGSLIAIWKQIRDDVASAVP